MTMCGHLWAIGYNDTERAAQVRDEIDRLGEDGRLILLNTAVVVRFPDGCATLDGEPFVSAPDFRGRTLASFFAALALGAPPLTGAAAGALARATCNDSASAIDNDFLREVEALMRPGTSALFVLDQEGNMDAILRGIRGLGGTILKTNVNLERAQLIQSTLKQPQD